MYPRVEVEQRTHSGDEIEKIVDVNEIMRTVVYSGKVDGSFVETRMQLHKEIISKSSLSIPPPDADSVEQATRR